MKITTVISICFLSLGLIGCSSKKGNGAGTSGETPPPPQSIEEALKTLSPQHKLNFETWQSKVVKSCNPAQAFGLGTGKSSSEEGIDGAALIKSNNGSVIFSDANNFAMISGYNNFSGIDNSKAEETVSVNGTGYSISAETKREGANCAVYLSGLKVYETEIAESFTIGTQYSLDKSATTVSQTPVVYNLGFNGSAEILNSKFFDLVSQTLIPTKVSQHFIGERFGLTAEQSAKLFRLGQNSSSTSSVRISNDQSAVWSNFEGGNLIAQSSTLKNFFDGTDHLIPLEIRLKIPQFDFKGTKNNSDNGNLKLILTASVTKKDNSFYYALKSLENKGLIIFDQTEASACIKGRVSAYLNNQIQDNTIQPSIHVMFSPCRIIFAEIEKVSYENGYLKSLVPVIFANLVPSEKILYGGWDEVLSYFAKEALDKGKNINSYIDPEGKTRIVPIIAKFSEQLKEEMAKSKNMHLLKNSVYQMGLRWSFLGPVVSDSKIIQIIQSIDNAAETFKASSENLLLNLGFKPNINEDLLSFALAIDSTYKSEALKSLDLSKEISYEDFETNIFNYVLQNKTPINELKDWSFKFSSIKTEINKFQSLGPIKSDLVKLTLKWLQNGDAATSDLAGIYSALNNVSVTFAESTKQLMSDLDRSLANNKVNIDFGRNMTEEYKQLAISIRDNSKVAEYESWGKSFFATILQKMPSIEQLRKWNELWSATIKFVQREKAKTAGDLVISSELNRRKIIEVAVNENWSNQDYVALETIAAVANAKILCAKYKDASSQADCIGIKIFSKDQRKLFDPSFAGRYTTLATEFIDYINKLPGYIWDSLRRELINEFFENSEPVWSKCDNESFKLKATKLNGLVNTIATETNGSKKWELEQQIRATIKNCQ